MMNKYNVKAKRVQLDTCVANRNWSAFRKQFISLLPSSSYLQNGWKYPDSETVAAAAASAGTQLGKVDAGCDTTTITASSSDKNKLELCRAIIEGKFKSKHASGLLPSLLHTLCLKFYSKTIVSARHKYPPVPVDVLEMVAQVCSFTLLVTPYGKRRQTPLALLLEQNPPTFVVERLLTIMEGRQREEEAEEENVDGNNGSEWKVRRLAALYAEDANSESPLMQSIKRLPDRDDIVELLVEFDKSSLQSLLCVDARGMIPLYYLLHRELKHLDSVDEEEIDNVTAREQYGLEQELPQNLLFLLLKTQQAILIRQGFLEPFIASKQPSEQDSDEIGPNDEGLWEHSSLDGRGDTAENAQALQAVLCCAHRLNNHSDTNKLIWILVQNLMAHDNLDAVDKDGNTFVHWICLSVESRLFLSEQRPFLPLRIAGIHGVSEQRPLLPFLIAHIPGVLLRQNNQGKIPLQVAIELLNEWVLIHHLLLASPESSVTPSSAGKLPLHTLIEAQKRTDASRPYSLENLQELCNAFPEAALVADPVSKLLPFQMAAASSDHTISATITSSSTGTKTKGKDGRRSQPPTMVDDTAKVSWSFVLLRHAPQILKALHESS